METRHLRYFLAVADTGSLTHAAEVLGIAQPALSQALDRMETLLGAKLLLRSRRGAQLTSAGQAILDDARLILARVDAAGEQARLIGKGLAGRLRVAFVAAAASLLSDALAAHRQLQPDLKFELREMNSLEQVRALERGEIDVGLLCTPVAYGARLNQRVIARDRMLAVVHDGFPVGEDGKASLRDMARAGLVFFGEEQAPTLRIEILAAVQRMGECAQVVQEASKTMTVLACVAARFGVSLLSGTNCPVAFPGVRYVEVRESHLLPTLEISALWSARSRTSMADQFVDLLPLVDPAASAPLARYASRSGANEAAPSARAKGRR